MPSRSANIKVLVAALTIAASATGNALPGAGAIQLGTSSGVSSENKKLLSPASADEVNFQDLVIQVRAGGGEAPHRVETPRIEAPRHVETPRIEAPRRVETPRIETPRRVETPRIEAQKPSEQPRRFDAPRTQAPVQTQVPSEVRLNTHQGGIGGQYKDVKLGGINRQNGNTFEGTTPTGDRVRFKTDANGKQRITSVVKHDPQTGREYKAHYNDAGRRTSFTDNRNGVKVEGRISKNGTKHIIADYGNGTRVVSRARVSYVEKSFDRGGRRYSQRTYWDRHTNRTYVRNYYYDAYGYRYYSPSWNFEVGFYAGFLFGSPWAYRPVYYSYYSGWDWYDDAWLFHPRSPYAYYFSPEIDYADPIDYVADYVIADTIGHSYQEQAGEDQAQPDQQQTEMQQQTLENRELRQQVNQLQGQLKARPQSDAEVRRQLQQNKSNAMITPEIKKQIAAQVRAELQAQQNQSTVPMSSVLRDSNYMFLNTEEMNLSYANEKTGESDECTLTEGDIFRLAAPVQPGDSIANILVVTAKKSDESCPLNKPLAIDVKSLDAIKNELAQRAETAAKALHDKQGFKGATPTAQADEASTREAQEQIKRLDDLTLENQGN